MAGGDIKGITIKVNGETSDLNKSLKNLESQIKKDDAALKQLDKDLKLDPKNTDLLAAKQAVLADKTAATADKMKILKDMQKDALSKVGTDAALSADKMATLQSKVAQTSQEMKNMSGAHQALEKIKGASDKAKDGLSAMAEAGMKIGPVIKAGAEVAAKAVAAVTAAAAAAGAALGAAFVGLGKEMISATTDTAKLADELNTLSKTTGISTKSLQEMNYMQKLVDVSTDTMTGAMTKLEKNMAKAADGGKSAVASFQKVGGSITDSTGHLRDNEDVFWDTIDALRNVSNETERDALAMELLGKSGKELNPLIEMSASELAALRQEAHDVGYVMDEETLAGFQHLQDNMDRLKLGAQSVKQSIGGILLPTLTELSDGGVSLLQDFAGALAQTDGDVEKMGDVVAEFAPKVTELVEGALPNIINVITSVIQALVPAIVTILPSLITALGDIATSLAQAIADNSDMFIEAFGTLIRSLVNGIATILPVLIPIGLEIITTIVDGIIENIDMIVDGAIQIITGLVNALTQSNVLTKLVNAAFTIVSKLALALLDPKNIKSMVEGAKELLLAIVKGISTNLPTILPAVVEAFATLATALTDPVFLSEMINALIECLVTLADTIVENLPLFVNALVAIIGNVAMALIENFPMLIETALRLVGELIFMVFETIGTLLGFDLDEIFAVFETAFETICGIFEGIGDWFGERWDDIKNVFSKVGEFFSGIFETAWSMIKKPFEVTAGWFSDLWEDIKKPFAKVGEFFEGAFKTVGDVIKAPLNGIIKGINVVIGALNSLSIDIPSWVPGIGGDTWGIDIPKVPLLAKGGVLEKGQLGFLEGSGAEAVVPLENNKKWIQATASALRTELDYTIATQTTLQAPIDYTSSFQMLTDRLSNMNANGEAQTPPTFNLIVQLGQQKFAEMVAQAQADNAYYAGGY